MLESELVFMKSMEQSLSLYSLKISSVLSLQQIQATILEGKHFHKAKPITLIFIKIGIIKGEKLKTILQNVETDFTQAVTQAVTQTVTQEVTKGVTQDKTGNITQEINMIIQEITNMMIQ